MFSEIGYIAFLLLALPYIESAYRRRLSEYVEHYEPLEYDARDVHAQHVRARRSIDAPRDLRLSFRAHGRHFKLRLRRDLSAFTDDFRVEGSNGEHHDVDTSHIYHGELADDPTSAVFGSVTDGVFEGKIMAKDGSYYIEHARRYFPPNGTRTKVHSVIYREGDVNDPYAHRRHGHVGGCGITDEVVQWMERIQNSGVDDEDTSAGPTASTAPAHPYHAASPPPHPNSLRDAPPRHWEFHNSYKYSRAANTGEHSRSRRSPTNRNTCSLYIQTDPLIWRHVREGFPDHREPSKKAEVDMKTREEILSLISHHVTAVNYIYRDTKFDGRMEHRNIKFEVQRIKIDDDSMCNGHQFASETNQFCLENIDVSNFLNLHSLGNHEDFCLAYVFTYRDFTGGTLGLLVIDVSNFLNLHSLGNHEDFCLAYVFTYRDFTGGTLGLLVIDVSNFLNLHSLGNHEDFCLAYVFTYRDFTGGTLGLLVIDVSNFLNLHSLGNHEDFCLAYVFTYRDFTGGTLGLLVIDVSNFLNLHSLGNHEDFCLAYVFTYRDFTGGTLGLLVIDVSNFLNLHSLGNHEDFCLAYVFTYRDFTGGTLGLAWVASASGASGGICEKYKTYTETIGGMYQSTKRSLNTGIITFVNYNSRVPPKVSQLTLAHEIGHNFGSPHDYPSECRPGGQKGNFIMFASATSGDRPNNSKFSACSVGNISAVLDAVRDGRKRNCLSESQGAFCGNKIVEDGEQCDCGYDELECKDRCCYPRQVSAYDREQNASAKGCDRRANTQCSPSQGPCCHAQTCQFVSEFRNLTCREATECSHASLCSGRSAECPEPRHMANLTKCNNGTQLCITGECRGSMCLLWNMKECFLSSSPQQVSDGVTAVADRRALCQLACQTGPDPASCRSTKDFAERYHLPKEGISLRPGSPCDNFQGYCDVFLKCRAVDAEGPLVRLKNLLLNRATLQSVQAWVTEHWWAVLLSGVALLVLMGGFVKCCAVHTPSSNPKRPPARRLSETLRRPMNTLRRMRHPGQAVPRDRAPRPGHRRQRHKGYTPPQAYPREPASAPPGPSRGARGEPYANAYPQSYEMRPAQKV